MLLHELFIPVRANCNNNCNEQFCTKLLNLLHLVKNDALNNFFVISSAVAEPQSMSNSVLVLIDERSRLKDYIFGLIQNLYFVSPQVANFTYCIT